MSKATTAEPKTEAKAEAKSASNKSAAVKAFTKLSAKERSELYAQLKEGVNEDNNQLSQGKEPADTKHYDYLNEKEEDA